MNSFDRSRQALAISLAALAGYVDAVGYLATDRYFVSFMSGNTTRLGADFWLNPASAITPALLIAGFVSGVALGAVIANLAGRWRKPAVLLCVTTLLLTATIARGMVPPAVVLALLVAAMGAINNTLQRDETPIGLTYMTGALVRIGQGIGARLAGKRRPGTGIYVLLWAGLAGGAMSGAAVYLRNEAQALWYAVILALVLTGLGWRLAKRSPG